VTNRAIAHARLRNSRLVGAPLASPEAVVGWFGALQAQDVPGALWAIAQRMPSEPTLPTIDSVGAAMDDGRILRLHALRPTWHFLVPSELRWIQALTGPRVHQVNASMYRRLGLDTDAFRVAVAAIRDALRGGHALTREELGSVVAPIRIDLADSFVVTHIAMHAELDATLCNGPRRGKQSTYMLVDERVPPARPLAPADALRELTARYFTSHGPALAHDMAWWSGLTVGSVREGIELAGDALEGRRVEGKDYWAAAGAFDPTPGLVPDDHILLLPNYDEAVASYSDYSPALGEGLSPPNWVNDSVGAHLVVRDGLVIGGWRRALSRARVTVTATLFNPPAAPELAALETAAQAFGRFLGLPAYLEVKPS
jgi:hypothetical protein